MKKASMIFSALVFLAAASFAVGAFVAERNKSGGARTISLDNVSQQNQAEIQGDKNEVIAEKIEENKTEEPLPESNVEKKIDFSFAILGDTQRFKSDEIGGYQSAVGSIKKMNPNLVFTVGDMVSSCDKTQECEEKLNSWKRVLGSLSSKTYVTQGNHDRTGEEKADAAWEKVFNNLPTNGPPGFVGFVYSFDFENSHFVVLDSEKPKERDINKTQLDWLEADLSKNKKENVFVFFHEPAYPTNSKIGESLDENPGNRDRLWSILTRHKVKAAFSGHEHIQSRRKVGEVHQFGFGNTESFDHLPPKPGMTEYFHVGQAFGLVEISGQEVTVKTFSVQGKLLDLFVMPN